MSYIGGHIGIADGDDCCSSFYLVEIPHSVSLMNIRRWITLLLHENHMWFGYLILFLQFLMEPSASLNKKMANHTIYIYRYGYVA